jgi:hypothetical protein
MFNMLRHGKKQGSRFLTHPKQTCKGSACCVHNPSGHRMREWPLVHRTDRRVYVPAVTLSGTPVAGWVWVLSERTCPHGVGHPDPDSLAYARTLMSEDAVSAASVHGCCAQRCCRSSEKED